ncbi:CRISPR-associated helicase Cas3' [Niallia sp. 03133]|uniref:CRISPR-associated helicase Cas3' n=1 Tax=Niallia sp. 03133 TaxID=3458060 RepID=UPI0040449C41
MPNLFLAKSDENLEETIVKHTESLLQELENLKGIYSNIPFLRWDLLKLSCIYHDVGKMNTKFQNKLLVALKKTDCLLNDRIPNVKEIPHGYLSCAFIPYDLIEGDDERKIVAQAVYFHHNRPAATPQDLEATINQDLPQYFQRFKEVFPYSLAEPKRRFKKYIHRRIRKNNNLELAKQFVLVKGLLNKIDHAASANIQVEIANPGLINYVDEFLTRKYDSGRNELQNYLMEHQEENNIVIASTGIGKTEAALYWIGNSKGFFTLPLRVSINSIYKRIESEINFKEVALLHSETESEYVKNDLYSIDYFEKTKRWSMPLTISTLDQLVDFVFKEEGFEKKLATLAYSKLIIDEIQMYSPKMVACLLAALKEITEIGGKFTIMTATFAPFLNDLLNELRIPCNQPAAPFFKKVNGQVAVRHCLIVKNEQINLEDIKKNKEDKKILIIVNTVKKAQEIYDVLIKDRTDVFLFHSRFTKNDRKEKEHAIQEMGKLKNQSSGIWITTQVVEASVDIDFDVLYTELSDLNGLFQRMGRVYRNRVLDHKRVNVFVYDGGNDYTSGISFQEKYSVVDTSIFEISKKALQKYRVPIIFTEELKMKLIESNYTTLHLKESSYYKEICEFLKILRSIREYEDLDPRITNLREIFNETIIPYFVYQNNQEEIDSVLFSYNKTLRKKATNEVKANRAKLRDELYGFTVDIPQYRVAIAKSLNRVEKLLNIGNYTSIKIVDYEYDQQMGLKYTNDMKLFSDSQFT